jgi:large repetitive protein
VSVDLGDLTGLATAIGLLDGDGNPVGSWFADPGLHLSRVLSNPVQRRALVGFVDELLGGPDATVEAGVSWLPVVDAEAGKFRLFLTLEEAGGGATIRIGAGVRVRARADGVECEIDAHVPLFVASGTSTVSDPLLLGKTGAPVDVSLRLRFPPGTAQGRVEIRGVDLAASVPTTAAEAPAVRLALRGLRMPGADRPRDLVVDAATADALDDALLELVFGLVEAQVAGLPSSSPLSGLAAILGLADDAVPDLPIADLLARGPIALADWFASAVSGAARQDWLAGLARLLGGTVVNAGTADATVEVGIGGAPVRLALLLAPGASSRPVVTPRLSVGVTGGPGARLALTADLVALDLGSGVPVALPRLAITGRLDPPGAAKLLPPVMGPAGLQVAVGALEAGLALDTNRRPVLVLTAEDADVGATHYEVLDLSTPDALAAVAGQAITDAAAAVLAGIGPGGHAVAILLGLADPPSVPGLPRVEPGELLRDPVAAVRDRWRALLSTHAASVPAVLEAARDTLSDARVRATAIAGLGTPAAPWRLPLAPGVDLLVAADGARVVVDIEAQNASDLGETGIGASVALRVRVAGLDLDAGTAAFLAEFTARVTLSAAGAARLRVGADELSASLASIGMDVAWSPAGGVRVAPNLGDVTLHLPTGDVAFPQLVAADGSLPLDAQGWRAVEQLAGTLAIEAARRTDLPWLSTVVTLIGWASTIRPPSLSVLPSGTAALPLSELITDPSAALGRFGLSIARDPDALRTLLEVSADMLARSALSGIGGTSRPWMVPLVSATGTLTDGAAVLPAIAVTLGAEGAPHPVTVVPQALRSWLPGDDGLEPDALVAAFADDAEFDETLADLLAGRPDVAQGLFDLIDRWTATDGLVTLPDEGLPDGVVAHRPADLAHRSPLAGPLVSEVLTEIWNEHFAGAAPGRMVFVAIDAADPGSAPPVLPTAADGLAASRLIDLTPAGLPPEAFTPPSSGGTAAAMWAVRLGSRAACRLPAGHPGGPDADGVMGQAARLRRILEPLATAGADVAVVAHGGAGHAAVRAVAGLSGVRTVVTIGTAWSPVSVDSLDALPAGDALRLLAALLRIVDVAAADPADAAVDPDEPDDPDLLLARGVVGALLALDPFADPLADVRPPGGLTPPAGLPVHAVVGSCSPPTLRRAITATVVAALAARARARSSEEASDALPPLRAGLRLPIAFGGASGGLSGSVVVDLRLASVSRQAGTTLNGPDVRVSVDLRSTAGWLVGGPDPARASSGARLLACRRVSAEVVLPIGSWPPVSGAATGHARVVLHDVTAFGTVRDRWVVESGAAAAAGATPLLPEVRAVLAEVAARLASAAAADSTIAALRESLAAFGIIGPDGGVDAITLERLLLDPEATVEAALGDDARRLRLAGALRAMSGDLRAAQSARDTVEFRYGNAGELLARVDLGAPAVTFSAAGSAATSSVPWRLGVSASPAGVSGSVRIGDEVDSAVPTGGAPATALVLTASAAGLSAELRQRTPAATTTVALWPGPSADVLVAEMSRAVPALATQGLLDALRSTLTSTAPTALTAVDALLEALGLLGTLDSRTGTRAVRSLYGLFANPSAWVQSLPAGLPTSVPALIDGLRGLLGAGGAAGTLALADGVHIRTSVQGPRLLVATDVDATAFTAPSGGLGLVLTGGFGLSVSTAAPGMSLPDVRASVGAPGVGALQLRVGPDGGGAGNAIGVTLSLAPTGRPEIVLLPGGAGLGGLADAAASGAIAALPAVLDAIAALESGGAPATPAEVAGRVVSRLGDALGLRSGSPLRFDQAALTTFGTDPAAALAARAAALGASGLLLLTEAVQPLLGSVPTRSVATADGALVVRLDPLVVRWRPGTSRVEAAIALTGVPGIESLAADMTAGPAGLELLDVTVGPASLDAGVATLAPYARVVTGTSRPDAQIAEIGLGLGATRRLAYQWNLSDGAARLMAIEMGSTPLDRIESHDPVGVAIAVVSGLVDLAGGVVLAVPAVGNALGTSVLGAPLRDLLDGVLLAPGQPNRFDPGIAAELADPTRLLRRLARLAGNLAAAPDAAVPIEGILTVRMTRRTEGTTSVFGLNVAIDGSWDLNPGDDVVVSLEEDVTWITPPSGTVPEGLTVELIDLPPAGPPRPRPGLLAGGLGVRLSRSSGPLLDAGISIGSIAVHLFGSVLSAESSVNLAGGMRLELGSLGVGLAGASGGDNAVAQGLMNQAAAGEEPPTPRFSPAVALQKHPGQALGVSLSAGPGSGPWWLTIQREFGPIYLEQIGLAVVNQPAGIESVGLLIDGRVSLMGLAAAVDDLSLTYFVAGGGSMLDPSRWKVDLAGFAVSADISGITLAGGLRRFTPADGGVEYLGMLMARVAVYGLTVYGGYGVVGRQDDRFTSLFLFGAINGPIGGPPAFFVTGIGGGVGINRRLSLPADLSQFGSFPLIKALDPAARAGDPFQELAQARVFFAAERGTFWFAAGLSFNSFALVDGIAVVAIQIGGGFEMSLLGLARMALPRPEAALVSIELALVARFSTRDGIILVQGQLTDNSWLLAPQVRLTGGFAFATWFSGPNRGQFVVSIGGYHPDFHRDGYPVVPRLGLALRFGSAISIVGESYFALTSEAVMAGTRMEITARLGPAWAHLVFGGDAIVFFDPFWFKVTVYASIDAGVTINLWLGRVTISVHLSARIEVTAPPLHAIARFKVGPVSLTLEFGERATEPRYIPWDGFVRKYLEEAAPGRARVLAAIGGIGSIPPSGSSATGGAAAPDGTPDRPFRMVPEFEMTITSTAPLRSVVAGGPVRPLAASAVVSVAPMGERNPADIRLALRMVGPPTAALDRIDRLQVIPQQLGAFPAGTWGVAPDASNPVVPRGDVISATDRVLIRAVAEIPASGPAIRYRQVETGQRRLLPFVTENDARRAVVVQSTTELATFIPEAATAQARLEAAATLLATRGGRSAADVAAWQADRAATPLLGSLGEGLGRRARMVEVTQVEPVSPAPPPPPRPPRVRALMIVSEVDEPITSRSDGTIEALGSGRTTVSPQMLREVPHVVAPKPTLADVDARLHAAVPARLLRLAVPAAQGRATVIAAVAPPLTRTVLPGIEIAGGRGVTTAASSRLAEFARALTATADRGGARVGAGEIAVLALPDAARDVATDHRPALVVRGSARVVALGPAGGVTVDRVTGGAETRAAVIPIPPATRSIVVVGMPSDAPALTTASSDAPIVAGWVAAVPLPSATDGVLVGAGCVLDAVGRVPERGGTPLKAGFVAPEQLVSGESAVTTTFALPLGAIAVALEGGSGEDVVLGIEGARRPLADDGSPERPVLVNDGALSILIFRLVDSEPGTALTVTSGSARRLAGVVGVSSRPAEAGAVALLADAIARLGLPAVVPPVTQPGIGGADISWKEQ